MRYVAYDSGLIIFAPAMAVSHRQLNEFVFWHVHGGFHSSAVAHAGFIAMRDSAEDDFHAHGESVGLRLRSSPGSLDIREDFIFGFTRPNAYGTYFFNRNIEIEGFVKQKAFFIDDEHVLRIPMVDSQEIRPYSYYE